MLEQQQIKGMSLADFMEQFEEQPFELIDGEIIPMGPLKHRHAQITKAFYDKLFLWTYFNPNQGKVFTEVPFVMEDKSDWVKGSRIPDVMFYQQKRLDEYYATVEDYDNKPFILVPDIVVEVVSPTDAYSDVNRKVRAYLTDAVKIIWVVDPALKTVAEYTQWHLDAVTKQGIDSLSGHDVAEGFELKVSEIFD